MAVSLNGSSDAYATASTPIPNTAAMTLAIRFYANNVTTTGGVICTGNAGTNAVQAVKASGVTAGDPVEMQSQGVAGSSAVSTTGYSASVWNHACGVIGSATDRRAFLNGGSKGTQSTSRTPNGMNSIGIGKVLHLTIGGQFFNGYLGEGAVWDAALADGDVAMLGKGFSPILVRPLVLQGYWPVANAAHLVDRVGGRDLTAEGSPASAPSHPPVFRPRR